MASRGRSILCQDDANPWIGSGLSGTSISQDTELLARQLSQELVALPEEDVVRHTCMSSLLEF